MAVAKMFFRYVSLSLGLMCLSMPLQAETRYSDSVVHTCQDSAASIAGFVKQLVTQPLSRCAVMGKSLDGRLSFGVRNRDHIQPEAQPQTATGKPSNEPLVSVTFRF